VNNTILRQDTYKHKGWRKQLLRELQEQGINNTAVLEAMDAVPRHFFLDPAFEQIAYENRAFTIAGNQTISQPYTVGFQSSLLNITKGDKILEIGTGSAYQATILATLGATVFTIERHEVLFNQNQTHYPLKQKPTGLLFFLGDGFEGLPKFAPFDKILITCGVEAIPPKLFAQLKIGGVMVIPIGGNDGQIMKRITKTSDTEFETEEFHEFKFVPMLKGIQ
jgi:protein-L-isoaspartate(D-aspartate) O-methyltransferase